MFARAAGMAAGGSGVSPAVLDALIALLNAGVHPVVPSKGSIGVADLAPLSHLALPLFGEGSAEFHGEFLPGNVALERAGLRSVTLGAKDGIALISANAATVGHAALVGNDASACSMPERRGGVIVRGFSRQPGVRSTRAGRRPRRGKTISPRG
jgi:histidine ammonia-lyase